MSKRITLVHQDGPVSLEHLASLSNLALYADEVHTARRSRRIADKAKHHHVPFDNWDRTSLRSQPVQQIDPADGVTTRIRVESDLWSRKVWEPARVDLLGRFTPGYFAVEWDAVVFTTTTTWHDQFVPFGWGSNNSRKSRRAYRNAERRNNRRKRKALDSKVRMSQHDLKVEALFDDVEPWSPEPPVYRRSRKHSMERVDDVNPTGYLDDEGYHVTARIAAKSMQPLSTWEARMLKHEAEQRVEIDAKNEAKQQARYEAEMQRWDAIFAKAAKPVQQPDPEAAAKRSKALIEDSVSRYFGGNIRSYVLANSRGAGK